MQSRDELNECVRRVMLRDKAAEPAWFEWAWQNGLRIAMIRCRDAASAQDAVQDSIIEALRSLRDGKLQDVGAFTAWFRTIVVRRCQRQSRRDPLELSDLVADPSIPPDLQVEQEQTRAWVRRAVRELDQPRQAAVALYYLAGYPTRQAADLLDLSLSAVKKRLHDAREEIRKGGLSMDTQISWRDEESAHLEPGLTECWGVDVGPAHLNAVRILRIGKILVVGGFETRYDAAWLAPDEDQAVGLQLRRFAACQPVEGKRLFISIPSPQVFTRTGVVESASGLREWVRLSTPASLFPIRWRTAAVDRGEAGATCLVAASEARHNQWLNRYGQGGMKVWGLIPDHVAQADALLHGSGLQVPDSNHALVNIGRENTQITIVAGGQLFQRIIPHLSLGMISDELARRLSQPRSAALDGLTDALAPTARQLEASLRESAGFFRSICSQPDWKPGTVVCSGPAAHHAAITNAVKRGLGSSNVTGFDLAGARITADRAEELRFWSPNLATAFGAALHGVGLAALDVNLAHAPTM